MEEMLAVTPAHRPPRGLGDWAAWKIVRIARWSMDFFTGMSRKQASDPKNPTTAIVADEPFTESQWASTFPTFKVSISALNINTPLVHSLHLPRKYRRSPWHGRRHASSPPLPAPPEA
jgi:hypothetical protein